MPFRHAEIYLGVRNALIVVAALALVVFWLVPMSPPRFAIVEIVDIVRGRPRPALDQTNGGFDKHGLRARVNKSWGSPVDSKTSAGTCSPSCRNSRIGQRAADPSWGSRPHALSRTPG